MACIELPLLCAWPAEGFNELAHLIVLQDVVGSVAIGDENRAIRRNGHSAGFECVCVMIDARLPGEFNGPLMLAVELELDDFVIGRAASVNELLAVFLAHFQAVNARRADGP